MLLRFALLLSTLTLAACSTTGDFTRAMDEPLKVVTQASLLAESAEVDVLKAHAVGMTSVQPIGGLADVVCVRWAGPSVAQSHLSVLSDAVDTVKKVGEKPVDTSYAGYIRKFRENSENAAPVDVDLERAKAAEKARLALQRCKDLIASDWTADKSLSPAPTKGGTILAILPAILALDKLIKSGLSLIEAAQREAAVRATIIGLIPQLREARTALAAAPTAAFGPMVTFAPNALSVATDMNKSNVGATITLRRWFIAQQISAQWTYLQQCRDRKRPNCLGEPDVDRTLNTLASNIATYRGLAKIDSTKVLAALQTAIDGAEQSLKSAGNPANLIDAIVGLADAVSGISDAYGAYAKTRN